MSAPRRQPRSASPIWALEYESRESNANPSASLRAMRRGSRARPASSALTCSHVERSRLRSTNDASVLTPPSSVREGEGLQQGLDGRGDPTVGYGDLVNV